MHRKFIALILASAMAVTGLSASPAFADGKTARQFGALALLGILALAISDSNRNRTVTRNYSTQPTQPPRPLPPRPLPPRVSRFDLPGHCLGAYNVNGGIRNLFGAKCLRKNYRHYNSLPYVCKLGYSNGRDRNRAGYEPKCLRARGYRVARN